VRTQHPPLTPEQQLLVEEFAARYPRPGRLLKAVWPSTYFFARRAGFGADEIDSTCWVAAIRAAQKFDPNNGAAFATYAGHWMRSLVGRDAGRSLSARLHKQGRHLVAADSPVRDFRGDLWAALGVADPLGPEALPDEFGHLDAVRGRLAGVLRFLPGALRRVIDLRFGLGGGEPLTLEQVGAVLGLSRERVRQLQKTAMERIRVPLLLSCGDLVGGREVVKCESR
jgi:RNA polymerase sigma factor (sigma-70 family)